MPQVKRPRRLTDARLLHEQTHTLGAILAGGSARRFGSDKAHALFDGKRLIDRVARTLGQQAAQIAVCGREENGFLCLADRPETGIGPLGGLNAALHHAKSHDFTHVLSAPCDTPVLPHNLSRSLIGEGSAIAQDQPAIGLWSVDLAPVLDAFISSGGRSLYRFAEHVSARQIAFDAPILNINRPEDLPD